MVVWRLSACLATLATHQWMATAIATCQRITSDALHATKQRAEMSSRQTTVDLGRSRKKAFVRGAQMKK
jgi:hypothetical protein